MHIPECSFLAVQNLSFCFILFPVNSEKKNRNRWFYDSNVQETLYSLLQFLAQFFNPMTKKYRNPLFCTALSHFHLQGHVTWTKYHWCLLQYVSKEIFLLTWKIYFNMCFFYLLRKKTFPDSLLPDPGLMGRKFRLFAVSGDPQGPSLHQVKFLAGPAPHQEAPLHPGAPVAPLAWPQIAKRQVSQAFPAATWAALITTPLRAFNP